MAHRLKYIGVNPTTDWLPGIPASDHTVSTKAEADMLVGSGLYELAHGGDDADDAATDERGQTRVG